MNDWENDTEFREEVLTEVFESDDSYDITGECGTLCIPKKEGIVPKIGSVARYYGKGFGQTIRGGWKRSRMKNHLKQ